MLRHKSSLALSVVWAFAACSFGSAAQAQTGPAAAERCASFNALSERHGDSAREILAKAQEQAKAMPAADAEKFLALNKAGADSEWQMSALARDAYRKCMQDYLAGGGAPAPQATSTATPAQQQSVRQPPQQRAKPKPVRQAQPAKKPKPVQQAQQKPRVQQKPSTEQTQRAQQEQPQETYRPLLPGLLNLGIGIGLGGLTKP